MIQDQNVEAVQEALQVEEEEMPFYGKKRYDIVDEVLGKIHEQEQMDKISPVQLAAMRAQDPFKTTSMKNL